MAAKKKSVNPEAEVTEVASTEVKGVKLKVVEVFMDKYTKQVYDLNDEIVVDEDRATELLNDARGFVVRL